MTCIEMAQNAKSFFEEFREAKKIVESSASTQITNRQEKERINSLAGTWFSDYSKKLSSFGIDVEYIKTCDAAFKELLKLSSGNNRRSSYQKVFLVIQKDFYEKIVIFLQTDAIEPEEGHGTDFSHEIEEILKRVPDKEENEYLREALGCWENGFLKASVVLIWCAAIDRIHKAIEQIGFEKFNKASEEMKSQTMGRFKRFDKKYSIQSISELRTVFDTDILWIIEGMQLIDLNQHTRLASCFDMRCHSGHPGEAPITKYNVLSCFSDIVEIVLSNPRFALNLYEKSGESE